jgi:vacuolar-type H+-ATPase subunit E/Vma4
MGCKELIESLRRARDEKIISIWNEAEGEADKVQAEISRKVEQVRADFEREKSSAVGEKVVRALSDANSTSRTRRLVAEREVSDRLFLLATASLTTLRNSGYHEVFKAMIRELPSLPWKTVRVNPDDAALAKEYFPGSEIIRDSGITGGVDAMIESGKVRVVNTFEKRLERIWDDILPGMLKDVYEELSKQRTA